MHDRELCRRILGIESPWYVERVDLKLAEGEVHVYLEHLDVPHWACLECGAAGDDRLTGTRYDWLRHPARKDRKEFTQLRNSGLKTARAWALKESAMALFYYAYERPARKHFRWWHNWAIRSRLSPPPEARATHAGCIPSVAPGPGGLGFTSRHARIVVPDPLTTSFVPFRTAGVAGASCRQLGACMAGRLWKTPRRNRGSVGPWQNLPSTRHQARFPVARNSLTPRGFHFFRRLETRDR